MHLIRRNYPSLEYKKVLLEDQRNIIRSDKCINNNICKTVALTYKHVKLNHYVLWKYYKNLNLNNATISTLANRIYTNINYPKCLFELQIIVLRHFVASLNNFNSLYGFTKTSWLNPYEPTYNKVIVQSRSMHLKSN